VNESTGRVFHVAVVFIPPKMGNQPVFPAKFGTLERLDYSLSTTKHMNMICRRILHGYFNMVKG